MRARQGLAVLLHLVAAEQFRSQRWLVAAVFLRRAFSVEARHQMRQVPDNRLAHLQAVSSLSKRLTLNEAERLRGGADGTASCNARRKGGRGLLLPFGEGHRGS